MHCQHETLLWEILQADFWEVGSIRHLVLPEMLVIFSSVYYLSPFSS